MNNFSIKINNLKKTFKNNVVALNNVDMEFKHGNITGLIGFNGSGKTTTFNIISGLLETYQEGDVLIGGQRINNNIRNQISYLSAGSEPSNQTKVKAHFEYIGRLYNLKKNEVLKEVLELSKLLDFSQFLDKRIKTLSKGNQQKVKLITAFINPDLKYLLLDEPFDGLDTIVLKKIYDFLINHKNNLTIIVTSHRMDAIDNICDEYYILKEGNVVEFFNKNISEKISIIINKEVVLTKIIKSLSFVISISDSMDGKIIMINDIKQFKALSIELLKCKKYVYHSLEKNKIAQNIMERHA